jgi:hypothetical protein
VPVDFGRQPGVEGYGIYNWSQDVLTLSAWYPLLAVYDEDGWNLDPVSEIGDSVYADMALYTVDLDAPASLVIAATGAEASRQTEGPVTRKRFVSGPVREVTLVASRDFQVESQTVGGTSINVYTLSNHTRAIPEVLQTSAATLQLYNERFGTYPYTELDVVEAPMRYAAGVEFPGIILVASGFYDNPSQPFFIETIAHEVAHQWWYNLVGNDVFEDPWMDEALTTYSGLMYFEASGETTFFNRSIAASQSGYQDLLARGADLPVAEDLAFFESLNDGGRAYGDIVYSKGGLFFHTLRETIGDAAFFQALQQYYAGSRYQIARPEDLLEAFEAAAGRQLDDLYQQWLFGPR